VAGELARGSTPGTRELRDGIHRNLSESIPGSAALLTQGTQMGSAELRSIGCEVKRQAPRLGRGKRGKPKRLPSMKGPVKRACPSYRVELELEAATQGSPVPPGFPNSARVTRLVEGGFLTRACFKKSACVGDGRNSSGANARCFPAHFDARLKSRLDTRRCFEADPGEGPSCSINMPAEQLENCVNGRRNCLVPQAGSPGWWAG
jgi:hypothetical protein